MKLDPLCHPARLALIPMALALPSLAAACACGCGIFDVGTSSMFANHAGGMVFAELDLMDQSQNRNGTSSASAAANADKDIRTQFWTVGGQYFFNRNWGASVEVPWWNRRFTTTDPDSGDIVTYSHGALGDVRIKGTYTGISEDMSTGLTLGVKLPTGDSSYANFDPDTEIGTGSTDLLLGAYQLGKFDDAGRWSWFAQAQWIQPLSHKGNYRPGAEGVVAVGAYFEGWTTGAVKWSPMVQLRGSYRRQDGGADGHPEDTGYTRWLASPGIEARAGAVSVYADVALPVYTNNRGNQLFAGQLWKLNIAYHF